MKKVWIILFAVLLLGLCTGGYIYYSYTQSPEYTLLQIKKSIEERDTVSFEKYVDIEGIIRRAGNQLAVELTSDFAAQASNDTGIPREVFSSIASIFGPSLIEPTIKQIRETLLSYIETRRFTPIQVLPEETVDIFQEEIKFEESPEVVKTGKIATIHLTLSVVGEPVPVKFFMRQGENNWEIVEIDQITTTVENLLAAKVTGERKRFERERAAHPNIIVDLPNLAPDAKKLELVYIPGGTFKMGSPENEKGRSDNETLHRVTISEGFYNGMFEVTNAQFEAFVKDATYVTTAEQEGNGGYTWDDKKKEYILSENANWKNVNWPVALKGKWGNHPVVNISWHDAVAYCEWLSNENNEWTFRLPTEAEWEYACRAGTTERRYWGDDLNDDQACIYANVHDFTSKQVNEFSWSNFNCDDGYAVSSPVGMFQPNEFGLNDMQGNVWEWCSDWYGGYPNSDQVDPIGKHSGSSRVLRGGSWLDLPWDVRSAFRYRNIPTFTWFDLGFRVVASRTQ